MTAAVVEFDPTRDKSYQRARLGPDVAAFLAWMEIGGASERTLDDYERSLSVLCKMYPHTPIEDVTDRELVQVAKRMQKTAQASLKTRFAPIRSFFKWGLGTRRISTNPVDLLPAMRLKKQHAYDLFTNGEVAALTGLPVRDGALMAIMFGIGARRGDCTRLRRRHWREDATVDAPYGTITFLNGKGGKDRVPPATELIAQKLSELDTVDGLAPADFLWYMRPGGRQRILRERELNPASFHKWWKRCLDEAGVRYRNPHLARHTFATNYLRGRGRLETLQLILGHSSIAITSDLYGHLTMRDAAYDLGLIEGIVSE